MKNRKSIAAWALLGLTIVGLASCGEKGSSTNSSGTGAGSSESSESTKTIPPVPPINEHRRITVTLKTDTIPSGSTFFDGCQPSVVYTDDESGANEEVYSRYNRTSYTIYNLETADEFEPDDALEPGNYICDVVYQATYMVSARRKAKASRVTPPRI